MVADTRTTLPAAPDGWPQPGAGLQESHSGWTRK